MYCAKFKDAFPFIKNGANIKQDKNAGGIPITRIETLAGGEFNTSRLGYANIFDISPYYEYVLNSGDILMSHINSPAYLGRAVVFEDKYDIVIHGMNLLRLKANKELIDSRYAVYLFSGNIFKEHIRKITKKSVNQASFSINDLKKIELQLPSIENQVIIAEKLDKLKMLIKKKNRLILFLDEIIKSRFVELIAKNKLIYQKVRLKDCCLISSGATPSRKNSDYWDENGINWFKTTELKNNFLFDSDEKISKLGYEKSSVKLLPKHTVLIAMYGQGKTRGMTGYLLNNATTNQACVALISLDIINPKYLWYTMINSYDRLRNMAKGGSQPNLSVSLIKDFEIILPPIDIQNKFTNSIEQINKLKSDVRKSIDETQLLMDSLMQEYFG